MNQSIVIDNGSGVVKAGFAGADKPGLVFRSYVGRTKHVRMMAGGALEGTDCFVGAKAEAHRGALSLSYPMKHGIVESWSDMEKIWSHIYDKENLNVSSEEHAVLLSEAPLNPYKNREKAAELFFEAFNVPALYCAVQAILSLYASGRTTGLVLDSGDGVTHAVPIYEGFALPHAIVRMDIAGRDVTEHMQLQLRRAGHRFYTSSEMEVVRQIKEKCCYVSFSPSGAEDTARDGSKEGADKASQYQLPDGTVINVGAEAFRAPEVLFQPVLIGSEERGVADCVVQSILKSDIDIRRNLFSQIVLSGGSTMFKGFGDRLLNDIRGHSSAPKETKIRIAAPPERLFTTWMGGSILASLATFKSMWISRKDYLEHGSRLMYGKQNL